MNGADRRRQIEGLCHAALEQDTAARAGFLATACGSDEALRREVEALLAHARTAEGFLVTPVEEVAAGALSDKDGASLLGRSLGVYQIIGRLGSGGMGEVYRARDTKLGRDVAIKILPKVFISDPERLARFDREARVLAALNHPNIATIHAIEETDGVHAIVMELVPGETLAEVIEQASGSRLLASGQTKRHRDNNSGQKPKAQSQTSVAGLSIAQALSIARQIAEGLEAAHDKGIVHRDLKPANVMITPTGIVKVLDFGLARAGRAGGAGGGGSALTIGGTKEGAILGTAAYMSPEQARGQAVDKRTDLWAFGCVLYEMLTGVAAFARSTVTDTLAAIVDQDVNWDALPSGTPPPLVRLLRRCLTKDCRQRLADAADARLDLDDARLVPAAETPAARSPSLVHVLRPWRGIALMAGAVAIAAIGAAIWANRARTMPPLPTMRFSLLVGEGQQFITPFEREIAISPDGSKIVYAANGRLYLRALGDSEARPIPGTDGGATVPEFSPDGHSLAFKTLFSDTIKRIGVTGGAASTVYQPASALATMTWGPDGITFIGATSTVSADPSQPCCESAVFRVSPTGGQPEVLVRAAADEYILGRPQVVNGQVVLFTRLPRKEFGLPDAETKAQIVAQSIRTGERRVLATGGCDARYLPTGHLVYAVGGALHAVRFDPARLAVVGTGAPVVEGVRRGPNATMLTAQYSVSVSGSLIYLPGPSGTADQIALQRGVLAEVDRSGQTNVKLAPRAFGLERPRYSPDGRQVAFEMVREPAAPVAILSRDRQPSQIAIYDLSGAAALRPLLSAGSNRWPIWSPDGRRVTFTSFSARASDSGLFWQLADGTGPAERLTKPEPGTFHIPDAWSSNGRTLLFEAGSDDRSAPWTLWTLSLPDRKIERFGNLESGRVINATFAPNGRWIAYGRGKGSDSRVYVEPFPRTGDQHVVETSDPARHPLWSPDGSELFYSSGPDSFYRVTFSTQPSVAFGNPVPVPKGRLLDPIGSSTPRNHDLSPDGQRILGVINAQTTQQAIAPTIQVIVNWSEELKAKVP